jgi:transcriptional regulator with XRE-family HTH domain
LRSSPSKKTKEIEILSESLKRVRESRGIGLRPLAKKLGKHQNYIYKIEKGREVGIAELLDIMHALDYDPVEFLREYLAQLPEANSKI